MGPNGVNDSYKLYLQQSSYTLGGGSETLTATSTPTADVFTMANMLGNSGGQLTLSSLPKAGNGIFTMANTSGGGGTSGIGSFSPSSVSVFSAANYTGNNQGSSDSVTSTYTLGDVSSSSVRAVKATGSVSNADASNSAVAQEAQRIDGTDDKEELRQTRDSLAARNIEGEQEMQTVRSEASTAQSNEQAGKAAATVAGTVVTQCMSNLTQATAGVESARGKVTEQEGKVTENKATVEKSKQAVTTAKSNVTAAEGELSAAEAAAASAPAESKAAAEAKVEAAKKKVETAKAELQKAEAKLKEDEAKLKESEAQLEESKTALTAAETKEKEAKAELSKAEGEKKESDSIWNTLKEIAKKTVENIPQMFSQLATSQATGVNTANQKLGETQNSAVNQNAALAAATMTFGTSNMNQASQVINGTAKTGTNAMADVVAKEAANKVVLEGYNLSAMA